jgi:hypothetical protein
MTTSVLEPRAPAAPPQAATVARAIPWHIAAMLVSATSAIVGVIWDISWHMTIGRDSFWTPAHLAIYLGGIVGGVSSGLVVLRTTFAESAAERDASVRFWGFRGPLGAWMSIWGALAMVVSAPFDDWWHNAYGLDVEILSPPHTVLAAGMVALALGAMLSMLALQNRASDERARRYALLYAYVSGCVLGFLAIMTTEYSFRTFMHSGLFYIVSCGVFPLLLVATGNTTRHRWGATLVAGAYTLTRLLMLWILPLFPAEPKLGPIYQDITHMVPMDFPLLLIVPAVVMDLVRQRSTGRSPWLMVVTQGIAFFSVFLVVQWLFAYFLVSPLSHNWLFAGDNYPYDIPMTSNYVKGIFVAGDATAWDVRAALVIAAMFAIVSASLGHLLSKWLRAVQR